MNESEGIKSFDALADVLKEQEKSNTAKLFQETINERFENIPKGHFSSKIPGVKSISFIPFKPSKDGERPQIHAVINYESSQGKENHTTWSIFQDGTILGKIPTDAKLNKRDLEQEIIYNLEQICDTFWYETDIKILPEHDSKEEVERPINKPGTQKIEQPPIDGERIEFLRKIDGAIFGFFNKDVGFDGYRAAIFPTFIVLENDDKGNAAFIVPLLKPFKIDDEDRESIFNPRKKKLDREKSEKLIAEYWGPIGEKAKTRTALRAYGAERIVHTPEVWKAKLEEAIIKRLKLETKVEK